MTNNKRVYTVEEIQAILGVSKNTTYALVKSGVFQDREYGAFQEQIYFSYPNTTPPNRYDKSKLFSLDLS